MRFALYAAILSALPSLGIAYAAGGGSGLLLGDIHYGYDSPSPIAGPHRLVMLAGMGNDHMRVDTTSAAAQRWFDYALTLARAFEHADAKLAFEKAASLDPSCSLCVWGEAYSHGPTINFLVDAKESAQGLALAVRAQHMRAAGLSPESRQLEAAMVDRYRHVDSAGSSDGLYARDLDALLRRDPDNLELAIFDAEAWLVMEHFNDRSGLQHAINTLAPLVAQHPDYTGLLHFYIHSTEDGGRPELAAPYAARLAALAPSASHLVHMPSHTYFRIGWYEAAAQANVAALDADAVYARKTDFPTPLGRLMYHFHNVMFGLVAATMAGDSRVALRLVDQFNRDFPEPASYDERSKMAAAQAYAAFGRFAPPNEVLAAPDHVASQPFLEAMRHYARGEAFARLDNPGAVREEAHQLQFASANIQSAAGWGEFFSGTARIAGLVITARGDWLAGDLRGAIDAYRKAANLQDADSKPSDDPPHWAYPIRRSLAAALLANGDAGASEREATLVLGRWELDPIALAIRAKAEEALKDPRAQFDWNAAIRAWHGKVAELAPGPLS